MPGGVFGPTERPFESPIQGLAPSGAQPTDVDDALRALYAAFPHPQLLHLIRRV